MQNVSKVSKTDSKAVIPSLPRDLKILRLRLRFAQDDIVLKVRGIRISERDCTD